MNTHECPVFLFYSNLFYSILFHSIIFYSIPFWLQLEELLVEVLVDGQLPDVVQKILDVYPVGSWTPRTALVNAVQLCLHSVRLLFRSILSLCHIMARINKNYVMI